MAISFKPSKSNQEFLANITNKNAFFNELISLIKSDKVKLIITNEPHKTTVLPAAMSEDEIKKEKLALDLTLSRINLTNQRIQESKSKTRLLTIQADYFDSQGSALSASGTRHINKSLEDMRPDRTVHNNAIYCHKCDEIYEFSTALTLAVQRVNFLDHWYKRHSPELPKEIEKELMEVVI